MSQDQLEDFEFSYLNAANEVSDIVLINSVPYLPIFDYESAQSVFSSGFYLLTLIDDEI
jgi:hypothetical protein